MQRRDRPPVPRRRGQRGHPAAGRGLLTLPVLAEVVRSGYREGSHVGSLVALGPDGAVVLARGDLERPVFPRSSNKPLQADGLLRQGWQPADLEELALATASHSGEPGHLEVVRRMLARSGLTEDDLGCPPGPTGSRLSMTCSGKHAATLTLAEPVAYLSPDHPVQRRIQATLEDLADERVQHVAVDGCGAPQHALTLLGLARAYRRVDPRVAEAMRARPWHVGGTGHHATRLMEGIPGLIAKDGVEGVYAAALPDGRAVALKIEDGADRARLPVLVAALRVLGVDAPVLDELATVPVLGGGRAVGEVRATLSSSGG